MQTTVRQCRCGIINYRQLREALGLTQEEFADLLCITKTTVWRLEQTPHHCPSRASFMLLKLWLDKEPFVSRLKLAGFPNPFGG